MAEPREVVEGLQHQSSDEIIVRLIDTTRWTTTPAATAVKCYDKTTGDTDVTSTVFPTNTPSEAAEIITLSAMRALTKGHTYRVEVKFTDGGSNTFECFTLVKCDG